MSKKIYYIAVDENELDRVEEIVYEKILNTLRQEIRELATGIAISVLEGKPIRKKRWYQIDNKANKRFGGKL